MGDERHPKDLAGEIGGFHRVFGELDAAAFAAAAGVDLGFDNNPAAELLGNLARFVRGKGDFAARHGHIILAQNALGLIFVNFHGLKTCVVRSEKTGKKFQSYGIILDESKHSDAVRAALHKAARREDLTEQEATAAMEAILSGEASPTLVGALLVALSMKGETADEVVGFARAMRAHAAPIPCRSRPESLFDTCGTGGDGLHSFNISTVSAFVVAGAGVAVAKHGNRSISSRCGSADVLEALGVNVRLTPEQVAASIDDVGIGFLFATLIHPAMRHAQPIRADLKMRTVFNMLGPLTNPAGAGAQVVGVFEKRLVGLLAEALRRLGAQRAFVVHGSDGLDEITTTGATRLAEVRAGRVSEREVTPQDFGLPVAARGDLAGGDAAANAVIRNEILGGQLGPKRDIVLANASAALVAAGKAEGFAEGVKLAADSIDSGRALAKLEALARLTRSFDG
jgi:anthranilate phosphoribosyltransferase